MEQGIPAFYSSRGGARGIILTHYGGQGGDGNCSHLAEIPAPSLLLLCWPSPLLCLTTGPPHNTTFHVPPRTPAKLDKRFRRAHTLAYSLPLKQSVRPSFFLPPLSRLSAGSSGDKEKGKLSDCFGGQALIKIHEFERKSLEEPHPRLSVKYDPGQHHTVVAEHHVTVGYFESQNTITCVDFGACRARAAAAVRACLSAARRPLARASLAGAAVESLAPPQLGVDSPASLLERVAAFWVASGFEPPHTPAAARSRSPAARFARRIAAAAPAPLLELASPRHSAGADSPPPACGCWSCLAAAVALSRLAGALLEPRRRPCSWSAPGSSHLKAVARRCSFPDLPPPRCLPSPSCCREPPWGLGLNWAGFGPVWGLNPFLPPYLIFA
ncbi:hypothetical protein Scep_010333 [Stephania cephalantha]|uniref:Uncharacterized protein n=1 Tax=Stephania cephalantha TaxID=152367 RepID=A0AAP0JUX3_9MAGN